VLSKMAKQRLISSIFSRISRKEQSASVAKDMLNNISKLFGFNRNFPNFRYLTNIILEILGTNLL
jgi:hypothetical protein